MFCPRCGQQAAEEVSFCSRCGLPLGAAAGLVEAGGLSDLEAAHPAANVGLTPRQRGTRKGLMITAGGVLFFVMVALLTAFKEDFFPFLILAGLIITVGIMRILYGLLLEEHAPADKSLKRPGKSAAPTLEGARVAELPPARAVPANAYAKKAGADTSDMAVPPPSVTEHTTRLLLDEDEAGRRP